MHVLFLFNKLLQCLYCTRYCCSLELLKIMNNYQVLEALTTEQCQERFSLERLEVLGDAFLKFSVARHFFLLHDSFHEGDLTSKRSNIVNNSNLLKLAVKRNLQVKSYFMLFNYITKKVLSFFLS